jgi:outer membrane protein assembly factor BamB
MCLKAASGREEWGVDVGTRIIGPAAADESRVYYTAMDNIVRAVSRGNGNRRWAFPLAYRPTRGPVVMGSQVAVPGITTELPGINAETGKTTGKLTFAAQLATGPTLIAPGAADDLPAVVSVSGGNTGQWTVSAAVPPPDEPAPAVPK